MTTTDHEDGPNVARIYDYFLGGAHHFAVDRARAEEILAAYPRQRDAARANRTFLRHAVGHALDQGVRQFLDLGAGILSVGNVHEIAARRDPAARVAYVDLEPVAVACNRVALAGVEHATITSADLREPDTVLAAPGVAGLLDLTRPVALLAVAALHFVPDAAGPDRILARYRAALSAGSLIALSHTSDDHPEHPHVVRAHQEMVARYTTTSNPVYARSRARLRELLAAAGTRPDADGFVEVRHWGPDPDGDPLGGYAVISEPLD